MKNIFFLPITLTALALFSACEEKKGPVEKPVADTENMETMRLGSTVDAYVANPTAENAADVDRAMAALDSEIAELDQKAPRMSGNEAAEARAKAANLREYKAKEQARFIQAKANAGVQESTRSGERVGERIENAAERTGEAVKDAAQSVKESAQDAYQSVRENLPGASPTP